MHAALIVAAIIAVTVANPQYNHLQTYAAPPPAASTRSGFVEVVPILQDERFHNEDGSFSYDVKTGNGISMSQVGAPSAPGGAVVMAGQYSYIDPNGELVEMKFIADENGFQPDSRLLPVAPVFPHPIPQFVLDQIAFAEEQDAARARAKASQVRSPSVPALSHSYLKPL